MSAADGAPANYTVGGPVTAASSGSMAFTGPGSDLNVMAIIGLALILIGVATFALVDAPRRLSARLAYQRQHRSLDLDRTVVVGTDVEPRSHRSRWASRLAASSESLSRKMAQDAKRGTRWLLGR